jgi:hypothetical protein
MHWHVATGLAGYGPDGSDGFGTGLSVTETAGLIESELNLASESARELAVARAAAKKYKDAWETMVRSDELDTLALNFSPKRKDAPLYKDNESAWEEEIKRKIGETFPLDIPEHSRLYVWEHEDDECEHLEEDE